MNARDSNVNIVSLFLFTIVSRFLRALLITLISDERYMCCLMKVQNNNPRKYVAYSLASYYLSFISSGI